MKNFELKMAHLLELAASYKVVRRWSHLPSDTNLPRIRPHVYEAHSQASYERGSYRIQYVVTRLD